MADLEPTLMALVEEHSSGCQLLVWLSFGCLQLLVECILILRVKLVSIGYEGWLFHARDSYLFVINCCDVGARTLSNTIRYLALQSCCGMDIL